MSAGSGRLGERLRRWGRSELDADRAVGALERLVGAVDGRRPVAPGALDSDHLVTPWNVGIDAMTMTGRRDS
jgi:hypothetical protein